MATAGRELRHPARNRPRQLRDAHWGYGFSIAGVAAADLDRGRAVSSGGVGFDIAGAVCLLASELSTAEFGGSVQP